MAAFNNTQGFGLLTLLVGMAVGGVLLSNLMVSIQTDLTMNRNLKMQGQTKDIANYIAVGKNCLLTTSTTNCPGEGYPIAIKKVDGTDLVIKPTSTHYTQLGSQWVKARCRLKLDLQNNVTGRFFAVDVAEAGQERPIWKPLDLLPDQTCFN